MGDKVIELAAVRAGRIPMQGAAFQAAPTDGLRARVIAEIDQVNALFRSLNEFFDDEHKRAKIIAADAARVAAAIESGDLERMAAVRVEIVTRFRPR